MRILLVIGIAVLLLGCAAPDNTTEETQEGEPPSPRLRTDELMIPGRQPLIQEEEPAIEEPPVTEEVEYDFSPTHDREGRLIVYFFFSPRCSASRAIIPEIDILESEYPDALFLRYNLSMDNGSEAYRQFAEQHNLSNDEMYVPQVLVNSTIITDRFEINESLEGLLNSSS
jgi:thiol-disulfide isomerase/thioredoxin